MSIMALALFVVILTSAIFPGLVSAQNSSTTTTVLMNDPQVDYGFAGQYLSFDEFTTTANNVVQYGEYASDCGGLIGMYNATAFLRLSFTGTSITTNLIYDHDGGFVQMIIDGAVVSQVSNVLANASGPDQCEMAPIAIDGLAPGPHTLQLLKDEQAGVVYVHSFVYGSPAGTTTALGPATTTILVTTTTAAVEPSNDSQSSYNIQSVSPSSSFSSSSSSSAAAAAPFLSSSSNAPSSSTAGPTTKGPSVAVVASIITGILAIPGLIVVLYVVRLRKQVRALGRTNIRKDGPGILDDGINHQDQKSSYDYEYGMTTATLYDLNPFAASKSKHAHSYSSSSSTLAGASIVHYGYDTEDRPSSLSVNQPLPPSATRINSFRLPPPGPSVTATARSIPMHAYSDSKVSLSPSNTNYIPLQPPQPSYSPTSHHSSHSTSSLSSTGSGASTGSVGPVHRPSSRSTSSDSQTKESLKTKLAQQELVRGLLERGLSAAEIAAALRVIRVEGNNDHRHASVLQPSAGGSGLPSNGENQSGGGDRGMRKGSVPPPQYTHAGRSWRP
ncbi:hypothetical protein FRB96_008880 [Tulasnella sp. 330]|nr:hypothetical protein FRB96_008880 [Tulasnella sp. 330]